MKMETNTLANGKMTRKMDRESLRIRVEQNLLENSKTKNSKD
jgi:hypothetical protein